MKIFFKTLNKQQDPSLHHFATSLNSSNNKKSIQFRLNSLRIMINNRIINPLSRNKKKKKPRHPSLESHTRVSHLYTKSGGIVSGRRGEEGWRWKGNGRIRVLRYVWFKERVGMFIIWRKVFMLGYVVFRIWPSSWFSTSCYSYSISIYWEIYIYIYI